MIAELGMGILGNYINSQFQQGADDRQNTRNNANTYQYMQWQMENAKNLTKFNREEQMQMWRDTNYSAQMEEMKKAGLNPSMIYGKGGGGGATTQVATSGGTSATASGNHTQRMDIGMATAQAQQISTAKAQENLINAQTAKTQVETQTAELQRKWEEFLQGSNTPEGQNLKERGVRLEQNKTIAELMQLEQNQKNLKAGEQNTEAETGLKKQAFDKLAQSNPMELKKMQKELELYIQDPNNTETAQWANMLLNMIGKLVGIGATGTIIRGATKMITK